MDSYLILVPINLQPHDIDHVIPKKVKKEMQQLAKNQKVISEIVSIPLNSLPKDLINHRPAPRSMFSRKQKTDNLESCIKKIKSCSKDAAKNSKDSQKINSKHNNEITEVFDKNSKQLKKRGRRGKQKIKS